MNNHPNEMTPDVNILIYRFKNLSTQPNRTNS